MLPADGPKGGAGMKREVIVLPGGQLLCGACGHALLAENGIYRRGVTHFTLKCSWDICRRNGERLSFPIQRVECDVLPNIPMDKNGQAHR